MYIIVSCHLLIGAHLRRPSVTNPSPTPPPHTRKEDIPPPHHAPLLTTAFFGMGFVFVALGFPTTLLAVLGGHVYGCV